MSFKDKLRARRAKERDARRRKDLLVKSVRALLLPAFIGRGFAPAPPANRSTTDRKSVNTFPFGLLRRPRADRGVDLVEIQFSTYQRAAFRINACPVPKEGMMTVGGHRSTGEIHASGLHDHFETHARPWLRPGLRALRLDPWESGSRYGSRGLDLRSRRITRSWRCGWRVLCQRSNWC
jgi:hypothetical protein